MNIDTLDVGVSRRSRVAAGGSQNSGGNSSQMNQRPNTGLVPSRNANFVPTSNFAVGSGDILDDAISRGNEGGSGIYRDRSKNLLSDAGSRFGDDDAMSYFMGQSEHGGASTVGAPTNNLDLQVPIGSFITSTPAESQAPAKPASGGSRRQQVLARQGLNEAGSKRDPKASLPP